MENMALLIEQSRGGDRDAFARIVEKYQGMVSAVTLNIVGDYAQSEDLAQETFLTAWRKLPELREPDKSASWFYGIAKRVALRWRERQQHNPLRGAAELDEKTFNANQEQTETQQEREQSLRLVWSSVKALPETLREPLLLYYRYSRSVAEIAESMQLSEEAVRQRLSRGRKMLKAEVEKQVESVLESTKPGEHFTVAVLAAIPVLATSSEVFAAGSAASTAGAAAKSSGGVSIFASTAAYIGSLINAFFFPWAVFFGVVFGAWNGVRNSPTLRSRRFMLKATVFQTVAGLSISTFLCVFGRSSNLFASMSGPPSMTDRFFAAFFTVSICLIIVYCVVSSYVINRRWRQIVEEDTSRSIDIETLKQSDLSLRRLRKFLYRGITLPFIAVLPTIFITMFMIELHGHAWWTYWEYIPYIFSKAIVIPPFAVLFIVIVFYFVVERKIRDEKSLEVWRPQVQNFLQVLKGEEKPKAEFRYRTNLWTDLLLVGVGLCMIQGGLCANYFFDLSSRLSASEAVGVQRCYLAVFGVSFVAYLLYAIYFAGIARKRYFGFIYLGLFQIVLCTFFALFIEPWLYQRLGAATPPWHLDFVVLGLTLLWLAGFVGVGVAGLLAFRKNNHSKQQPERSRTRRIDGVRR